MEAVDDAIYPNLLRETYDQWVAANYSTIKHMSKSPAHVRQEMIEPPWPSKARAFGNVCHIAVLEPGKLSTEYAVPPNVPKVGKVNIATWNAFEHDHPDMVGTMKDGKRWAITSDDMDAVHAISQACWEHPRGRQILEAPGQNELSAHWTDEETGQPCKGRMDRVCVIDDVPIVVDFKTTAGLANPWAFASEVSRYTYHLQAAWYLHGLTTLEPSFAEAEYWFLVAETAPPHGVRVMRLATEAIELGWERMRGYMDRFAECKTADEWPGYDSDVALVSLPGWEFREAAA